jgi:hypothetical protein
MADFILGINGKLATRYITLLLSRTELEPMTKVSVGEIWIQHKLEHSKSYNIPVVACVILQTD